MRGAPARSARGSRHALLQGLEPLRDLLARPLMVVVQMHHDGGEAERLAAVVTVRALAHRALEAVEEPLEILRRTQAAGLARQPIHALVGRAQGARRAPAAVVVAKRLVRAPQRAVPDELRQFLFAVLRLLLFFGHAPPANRQSTIRNQSAIRDPRSEISEALSQPLLELFPIAPAQCKPGSVLEH